jgi:FtsP/CotA-like multicopper oxidase with cupredoxin domain
VCVSEREGAIDGASAGAAPVANYEVGWKDTAVAPAGQITSVLVHFADIPGRFVFHCHMLDHEARRCRAGPATHV